MNGDGLADFGVSGNVNDVDDPTMVTAFVLVYLGVQDTGPDLANPNLIIRGALPLTPGQYYFAFCGAGNFTGHTNGEFPIDSIAVGSPSPDGDRVHIIPGASTWNAATAISLNLRDTDQTTAFNVMTVVGDLPASTQSSAFGGRCSSAGNVLPTPGGNSTETDDLLILQSGLDDARLFLIPGRPYSGSPTVTLTDLSDPEAQSAEDAISLRLRQDADPSPYQAGFGTTFEGGVDMTGDGVSDVVVAHAGALAVDGNPAKSLYVFDGALLAAGVGGDVRVGAAATPSMGEGWAGANGYVSAAPVNAELRSMALIGDWDGWAPEGASATVDLVSVPGSQDAAHFRMNHGGDEQGMPYGLFAYGDGVIGDASSGGAGFGFWVGASQDLNGDGRQDVVVGTLYRDVVIIW